MLAGLILDGRWAVPVPSYRGPGAACWHPGAGPVPIHPHLPRVELGLLPALCPQLGVEMLSFPADVCPGSPDGQGLLLRVYLISYPACLKPRSRGPVARSMASLQGWAPCFSFSTPQTESSASYSVHPGEEHYVLDPSLDVCQSVRASEQPLPQGTVHLGISDYPPLSAWVSCPELPYTAYCLTATGRPAFLKSSCLTLPEQMLWELVWPDHPTCQCGICSRSAMGAAGPPQPF